MTENDFLSFIFKLNPILVAFVVWLFGFSSLVLVALKTKSFGESILKSPGVMIGDFFLLPVVGFLTTFFYQAIQKPSEIMPSPWWNVILIIALILALISAFRFKHISVWWLPHNIFYLLTSYVVITFLIKGLLQLASVGEGALLWFIWVLVLGLISTHQLLGVYFPKRFPQV